MPIPQQHQGRYIYHMTHFDNLESILKKGLLCTNEKIKRGITHRNVANQTIQGRRAEMPVTCEPNGTVHDYVPFYFCPREPMLLGLLNKKNVDQQLIIYLAVKIDVINQEGVVFTSASANTGIPPEFYNNPDDLENLKWNLIDSEKWTFSCDDDRHAKMAEVLILNKVPFEIIDFIVVWNQSIKEEVVELLAENKCNSKVILDGYKLNYGGKSNYRNHYFTKFWSDETESLITGPYWLARQCKSTLDSIINNRQNGVVAPKFKNITSAIENIAQDFSIIPELQAIRNLQTDNSQHWQNVGDHTLNVVEKLEEFEEYSSLSAAQQKILKFSAYLHDIGKVSSPRDIKGRQKADGDHPANALILLERILSEDIERLSKEKIRQIIMLVAYHDIIGDIIGRGRDKSQLLDVITEPSDFDMLVALSKADIASLIPDEGLARMLSSAPQWLEKVDNGVPDLRDWALNELEKEDD